MNENDLLNLADDFKEAINMKNKKIAKFGKMILLLYGLIRIAHEHEDISFVDLARTELSAFLEEEFNIPETADD